MKSYTDFALYLELGIVYIHFFVNQTAPEVHLYR